MEDIKAEMRLGELKKENLRKSFEEVRAQATSMLVLSAQWKELETHLDVVQNKIEQRAQVLDLQEKEVETKKRLLIEKENEFSVLTTNLEDCRADLQLKQGKVDLMQKRLEQCSLEFELKTKDLESINKSIEYCSKELGLKKKELCSFLELVSEWKEKQLGLTKERVEKAINDIERKLESVTRKLDDCFNHSIELEHLKRSTHEKFRELELDLDLKENAVKECDEELEKKSEELECLQNSIKECSYQLDLKQIELVKIQEVIEEKSKQLIQIENIIHSNRVLIEEYNEELQAKEEIYNMLSKSVTDHAAKLKPKERDMGLIEKKIKDINAKLDSFKSLIEEKFQAKEEELNAIQMCIEARREELLLKEEQLSSVQNSMVECSKQLKLEEGELNLIKKTVLEHTEELESKQQHLEALKKSHEQLSVERESKQKQVDLIEKECSVRLQEADMKEKHLDLLKRSLEERLEKLETEKKQFDAHVKEFELKEKQFEAHVKEFEQREKQFDYVQKAVEEKGKEVELKEKLPTNALYPSSSSLHVLEVSKTETVNPVIPSQIMTEQPEHIMVSNTTETSPAWAATAMDGRSLQSIGIECVDMPDLRQNEVLDALRMSPHPAKFVLDLMLETYYKHLKSGGTRFEESSLKIYVFMLEQLLKLGSAEQPYVRAKAMELGTEWKARMELSVDNIYELLAFWLFVTAFGLVTDFNGDESFKLLAAFKNQQTQSVLALTDKIQNIISCLLARKQYVEAVTFVCAFGYKDKCPPLLLLNQFWEDRRTSAHEMCMMGKDSPVALGKAKNMLIDARNSITECLKNCNLEANLSTELFEWCISDLEKQSRNRRFSATAPRWTSSNTCPSPVFQNQAIVPTVSIFGSQVLENNNKRARIDGSASGFYTPWVPAINHPYFSSASNHELRNSTTGQFNAAVSFLK